MAKSSDWLSRTMRGKLDHSLVFMHVFTEEAKNDKGELTPKWRLWNIPTDKFSEFGMAVAEAQEAYTLSNDEDKSTKVVKQRARVAFKALAEIMRFIKKRWLISPPLTEQDLVSLGLKVPDKKPSRYGAPTARIILKIKHWAPQTVGYDIEFVDGDPADPANKEFLIWYKVCAEGEAPPSSPEELTRCDSTRKMTGKLKFGFTDSAKTVYISAKIVNNGQKGPFGPMIQAVIP